MTSLRLLKPSIPGPYLAAAALSSVVTLIFSTEIPRGVPLNDDAPWSDGSPWDRMTGLPASWQTYAALCIVTSVLAVAAPLVALRRPGVGAAMAVSSGLPLLAFLPMIGVRVSTFVALLGVAISATRRNPRQAWLIGVLSLLVPAPLCFSPDGYLWTQHDSVTSTGWDVVTRRLFTFALYAAAVTLALGLTLILNQRAIRTSERRELARRTAAVDERAALARDLHDVVAHRMSLVAVRAETAPYAHPGMTEEVQGVLAGIATDARAALAEMRDVLGVLRDEADTSPLRPQPDATDIGGLIDEARAAGSDVEVTGDLPETDPLSGNTAYRVVQEALTNARRHGSGRRVTVLFLEEPGALRIVVGNPSTTVDVEPGRGLSGMRERVERTGGRLRITTDGMFDTTDRAFTIDATIPRSTP